MNGISVTIYVLKWGHLILTKESILIPKVSLWIVVEKILNGKKLNDGLEYNFFLFSIRNTSLN